MFNSLDLFAGIGGFHRAVVNNGGSVPFFSEIAKDAIEAYCKNYGVTGDCNIGDITKVEEVPYVDFITAGVPCQSWSIAGKKLGFEDDRGQLWNDTIYLLDKIGPKAFLFENVKGLADKRNQESFNYIIERIREAGYNVTWEVLNSYDYGSPQMRERVYIVGFRDRKFLDKYLFPAPVADKLTMHEILTGEKVDMSNVTSSSRSLSKNVTGENDYYIFTDVRSGPTTIHSWDLIETSPLQKRICDLMLKNRRKPQYGPQDGNPLSLQHIYTLLNDVTYNDTKDAVLLLVDKGILRSVNYWLRYTGPDNLGDGLYKRIAELCMDECSRPRIYADADIKKYGRVATNNMINSMVNNGCLDVTERRFEFVNSKVSTGIDDVYRVFLRSCNVYPTLVASDTRDYVATVDLSVNDKAHFIEEIAKNKRYRKITKAEACRIQGYPEDFVLPERRARWMKLIGNSVTVPVIDRLVKSIVDTGVFD